MPTTTRSRAKQTKLEDFTAERSPTAGQPGTFKARTDGRNANNIPKTASKDKEERKNAQGEPSKSPSATKRKQLDSDSHAGKGAQSPTSPKPAKKQRRQQKLSKSGDVTSPPESQSQPPILINRAPVLQLWGASVAQFLNPAFAWSTCLGIGSQISTLCAISKGRSIGKIDPADPDKKAERDEKRRKTADAADGDVEVMGFPMHVKDGEVFVQGKSKKASEEQLQKKFGEDGYVAAKQAMEHALSSWKGHEQELDKEAFAMYEHFRPSVQSGQGGWGRKGELKVETIQESVRRS